MIHHIQRSILDKLSLVKHARFGQLKPHGMDGNMFTYHIKQLIAAKLVVHTSEGNYQLTQKGKSYIVHRYEDSTLSAHTIFLVIMRHGDQILLRKRLVQPMLGYSGFLHGEPQANKTLDTSVSERVMQKTGLQTTDISVLGSGFIRIQIDGTIDSFSHAVIVSATTADNNLTITKDSTGENYWTSESDLGDIQDLLPSCYDILKYSKHPIGWFDLQYTV